MEKNNVDFTHWFFDLDNTLYCANSGIFDQIHKKMGEFISKNLKVNLKKAKFLQKKYFIENGTTLHGLMTNHNINPKEFLSYVHDIDFSIVKPDEELNNLIKKIQGRKIVFTNANISYVEKILRKKETPIQEGDVLLFQDHVGIFAEEEQSKGHGRIFGLVSRNQFRLCFG